jgi:hypothetical protein
VVVEVVDLELLPVLRAAVGQFAVAQGLQQRIGQVALPTESSRRMLKEPMEAL